jgi:hypothetical protein
MKVLMAENKKSEKENTTLTTQRDSSCPGVSKKYNETLVGQNEELSKAERELN